MQVKRLIELLSEMDPDAHVFVGDGTLHTRTWDVGVDDVHELFPGAVLLEAPGAPEWSD